MQPAGAGLFHILRGRPGEPVTRRSLMLQRKARSRARAPVPRRLLSSPRARRPFCPQMMYFCVLRLNFVCGFLSLSLQGFYLGSARRDGGRGFPHWRHGMGCGEVPMIGRTFEHWGVRAGGGDQAFCSHFSLDMDLD